ncbi:hypothetical protein LTR09_005199 [Extremus antarcticus]|uniref:Aminoglycoside phosphotransferase domain-containing protein n=1 Tax=Extremus antarcticus TaxID=702011 RepID=A0AAJ0G9Z8_9PEZI|nr:hypothetical protein LTR09_005199 [Extremus antarcticus]
MEALSKGRQEYVDKLFTKAKEAHLQAMTSTSSVTKHNSMLLRELEKAFAADSELDLAAKLTKEPYADTIKGLRKSDLEEERRRRESSPTKRLKASHGSDDEVDPNSIAGRLNYLRSAEEVIVKQPLAHEVTQILCTGSSSELSASNIVSALSNADVVFQCQGDQRRMVLRVSKTIVAKIGSAKENDGREYSALQHIREHLPGLSVPRPLGEIQIKKRSMMFMSYLEGQELDGLWLSFTHEQKRSIAAELETFFSSLRSLRPPEQQTYGGVGGQGCLDQRRHNRRADHQISNPKEFEDFFFSKPHYGSKAWVGFLRKFYALPDNDESCDELVFTHGDLRLANIMVT